MLDQHTSLRLHVLLGLFIFVNCSHFRGGTISWKPTGNGFEVEFKYKMGFSYGRTGCNETITGTYVFGELISWDCTSGCNPSTGSLSKAGYICTAASFSQGWDQGEYTFRHTFSGKGPFTVAYSECCWIDKIAFNGSWNLETTVNLRTRSDLNVPNSSPVAAAKPLYTIKYGCTQKLTIPVLDLEGDNVRCRWAKGPECASVCSRNISAVLNENDCTITITASFEKSGMYAFALMIEDRPTSTIVMDGQTYTPNDVLSTVPLQFIIQTPDIPSRSCSDRPVFEPPTPIETDIIAVTPGLSMFLSLFASSRGASIKSFLVIGPPGLRQPAVRPVNLRPGVYSIDVTWTPTVSDRGPQSLCAEATDSYEISSDMRCFTIAAWDIDPCTSDPCKQNGTCTRVGYTLDFTCACLPGYTGQTCQTDINECASSPCLNGATCFDLANEYFCGCPDGFPGINCQRDINECETRSCGNGGACLDTVGAAACLCRPGFTGEICQTGIDFCESQPCKNGGSCVYNETRGYACECTDGWYGRHCAIRHENESFANNTYMTTDNMHYSMCDCFFGHDSQDLCHIYNDNDGIRFGELGAGLGMLTVFLLYTLAELFLIQRHTSDPSKETKEVVAESETTEDPKADKEENSRLKEKPVVHRHRSCWACDVKQGRIPPPPWLQN